jgi:Amt family ammonium transporter
MLTFVSRYLVKNFKGAGIMSVLRHSLTFVVVIAFATLGISVEAFAQAAPKVSGADTAWVITATALVLFMTMPGLALFYGGLVRSRSVLSVLMHCAAICCLMSVLWLVVGYSLAFGDGGAANGWIGGLGKAFLSGVGIDTVFGTIPEIVFFMFQMTFAIITPALIVGAYVERITFPGVMLFSGLWLLVVYAPVCHWIWGGGWLAKMGVMDFAGGLVVHLTAGVSAIVIAKMLGPRRGFPREVAPPHNPGLVMIGAAMLWVGWYGFNGGSALAANGAAGMAIAVTHISAAVASLTWMAIEWVKYGKPSLVGFVTGTIAGLATITPASGFVGPLGAVILGIMAACICYILVGFIKQTLKIDDSLDVFAVHGIGGLTGTLMTAILCVPALGGLGFAKEGMTMGSQLGVQLIGALATAGIAIVGSIVILMIVKAVTPLRVSEEDETEGLDITAHGERGYNL